MSKRLWTVAMAAYGLLWLGGCFAAEPATTTTPPAGTVQQQQTTQSAPTSKALLTALSVFSGSAPEAPLWATTFISCR